MVETMTTIASFTKNITATNAIVDIPLLKNILEANAELTRPPTKKEIL